MKRHKDLKLRDLVDLERGILWKTDPLLPLQHSQTDGLSRHVLARPAEDFGAIWYLDLNAGVSELLIAKVDCDGHVVQDDISESRAIISCLRGDGFFVGDRSERVRYIAWTEVIDFKSKTRWRTKAASEGKLTESGIAVGIVQGKLAQLAIIHTQ